LDIQPVGDYAILSAMKTDVQGERQPVEGEFWTERLPFFTMQFPISYTKPQKIWADSIRVKKTILAQRLK
jgi:hypothetical protein